jgi:signal transduction histidine kinase
VRDWTARRLAWSIGCASIALLLAALVFKFVDRHEILPEVSDGWGPASVFGTIANMGPAIIGILIVPKRKDSLLGWVFVAAGAFLGIGEFARAYAVHALVADPGSLPLGGVAGWISNVVGPIPVSLIPPLFLLFPSGTLPSRRWRPVAWLSAVPIVLLPLAGVIFATANWSRPLATMGDRASGTSVVALVMLFAGFLILSIAAVLAVVAVAVRFRRSTGDERQQLKWFVAASIFVAATLLAGLFTQTVVAGVLFDIALIGLYAAIVIAVMKYRLYDIDLIISRTVVYGGLAGFISVVYVGLVVVIGAFVGATEGLALLATAIVAIAFQPARVRAQAIANQLVYGERATPYEVLSAFSERIGETEASEDLLPRMARVLAEGTGATHATVWLGAGAELRAAASWPEGDEPGAVPIIVRGELQPLDGGTAAVPVRHQGELLGALTLTKPASETLTPTERKLVADLAAQAGLVLLNVRLIEDLRASRQRLVAAQDEERVRLERNLHDGAQQQLVALAVKQRLVESFLERDPAKARELMAEVQTQTAEALDTLRDLARGIYPPILADRGLEAALEAQIRRAAVPIELEANLVGRFPREIETAVYFSCLEALQNVAKYANASRAVVRLSDEPGWITFTVADDGVGFEPARTSLGTGLLGIQDRVEALGGTLDIRSRPRSGTNITGRLPVPMTAPIQEPVRQA